MLSRAFRRRLMRPCVCLLGASGLLLRRRWAQVERQFRDGMKPIVAGKAPQLDDAAVTALITACIKAVRVGFDRPWAIPTLEKQLAASMAIEQQEAAAQRDAPSAPLRAASSIATDPVGYLLGLVLGSADLPLATGARDWLASPVAAYLDPFIDGEVPADQYVTRSAGTFMARLQQRWAADGRPGELAVLTDSHRIC